MGLVPEGSAKYHRTKGGESMEFLTVNDVCDLLKISRWTVSKLVESGNLKASKVGRIYRFRREDVDDYLERNTVRKSG